MFIYINYCNTIYDHSNLVEHVPNYLFFYFLICTIKCKRTKKVSTRSFCDTFFIFFIFFLKTLFWKLFVRFVRFVRLDNCCLKFFRFSFALNEILLVKQQFVQDLKRISQESNYKHINCYVFVLVNVLNFFFYKFKP